MSATLETLLEEALPEHVVKPFDRLKYEGQNSTVLALDFSGLVGRPASIANAMGYAVFTLKTKRSPFAEKMLGALRRLTKERQPHPCGGFTTDDMQWQMGTAFTAQETLFEALDELEKSGLIRHAGDDEMDAIGTCYELKGGAK